ncbi:hypothetical protein BDB00DRAFT_930720 [Zychaea mexicana]|uniref:uncharacterized protein n=1 Tax=Zychaea mexicana TaxID=64656 RepID=UPI0022FE7E19|nr:uncharacterized protein BDB00DRAFT_930720 [Zychaea mexicana]KAI9491146.1 hypothetical protein BDB00DRAFT_930720 [Zychaea mexicana]
MRANMRDGLKSTARSSSSLTIPTFVVKPQRESGNKRSSGKHRIDKQCPSLPMVATWSKILQRQKLQQCIRQFNPFRITRCNVTATLITTIQISQRQVKEMKTILIYLSLRRGDLWKQQHGDKKTRLALSAFNTVWGQHRALDGHSNASSSFLSNGTKAERLATSPMVAIERKRQTKNLPRIIGANGCGSNQAQKVIAAMKHGGNATHPLIWQSKLATKHLQSATHTTSLVNGVLHDGAIIQIALREELATRYEETYLMKTCQTLGGCKAFRGKRWRTICKFRMKTTSKVIGMGGQRISRTTMHTGHGYWMEQYHIIVAVSFLL